MQRFRVSGEARLSGEVHVAGAKNSALKLMAAALLAPGTTVIRRAPAILDVAVMAEVLRRLGADVSIAPGELGSSVSITVPQTPSSAADYDLVRRMRASICVLGPLLARTGEARVALPGGDAIGSRGLDMHIAGLERLGASVGIEHGFLVARSSGLIGTDVLLDFPSVGATEQMLCAAVLAKGESSIGNAAREPEVADLCRMLVAMGAQIEGIGTSTLQIEGVEGLHPVTHDTVADRIVAGTWAVGAVMTRGDVTVRDVDPEHLDIALGKLVSAGASVDPLTDGGFRVRMERRPTAVDVATLPYPGFPTDLMPMAIALNSVADGTAMVTENVFEGRFMFVNELARLGANVRTDGHHAVVRGRETLSGAPVRATDIRAGAGLVLAGLCADGVTDVSGVYHVDRGYPRFEDSLRALGADVERIDDPEDQLLAASGP